MLNELTKLIEMFVNLFHVLAKKNPKWIFLNIKYMIGTYKVIVNIQNIPKITIDYQLNLHYIIK